MPEPIVSFMDLSGIKKANVVGHHVGGKVALELAVTWATACEQASPVLCRIQTEAGESIVVLMTLLRI